LNMITDQLEGCQRHTELLPVQCIFPSLFNAVFQCTNDAEADTEAGITVDSVSSKSGCRLAELTLGS
jgi:hypothetical protein